MRNSGLYLCFRKTYKSDHIFASPLRRGLYQRLVNVGVYTCPQSLPINIFYQVILIEVALFIVFDSLVFILTCIKTVKSAKETKRLKLNSITYIFLRDRESYCLPKLRFTQAIQRRGRVLLVRSFSWAVAILSYMSYSLALILAIVNIGLVVVSTQISYRGILLICLSQYSSEPFGLVRLTLL